MGEKLLEVKNLTIGFPTDSGMHTVVDDVSFTMRYGEIVGIVGESGSGKSMTVQTIMGLKKPEAQNPIMQKRTIPFSTGYRRLLTATLSWTI